MASFPGWTWEYIDEFVTLPRLAAINAYHALNPPVHLMIARYLGFGDSAKPTETAEGGLSLFDVAPRAPAPFKPGALPGGR